MIIGLDISTSVVGVCILVPEVKLLSLNYINLEKEKSIFDKASKFKSGKKQKHFRKIRKI